MIGVVIGLVALTVGILLLFRKAPEGPTPSSVAGRVGRLFQLLLSRVSGAVFSLLGLFLLTASSFVFIDGDRVGHLNRIYAFEELPEGRIIALDGQKGKQARILGSGFHLIPLVRVLYDVEECQVIIVPDTAITGRSPRSTASPCHRACISHRRFPTTKSGRC